MCRPKPSSKQRQPISSRKLSASIFTVGCLCTKALIGSAATIMIADRDDHRRDHHPQLIHHPDGGDHRIQREDDVEQHDLDDHPQKRSAARPEPWPSSPSSVVDFDRALGEQEQAADDEDQIAPGDFLTEHGEERRGEPDDPRKREQQQHARNHGAGRPSRRARACCRRGQLARQNRDENDVVDAEDDFQERQRRSAIQISGSVIQSMPQSSSGQGTLT